MNERSSHRRGFTLLELAISLALVVLLLAVLIPALASARADSLCAACAWNQQQVHHAWHTFLEDHDGEFPYVPTQPAWHYAGVRFSAVDGRPLPDSRRPLTEYLPGPAIGPHGHILRCPADDGITGETEGVGTGRRTAFRAYGTSYRANAMLLDARLSGRSTEQRGLRRSEVSTVAARLVLMGDPIWFELREETARDADWHSAADKGNILFLDGSVKFMTIPPRSRGGVAVFKPRFVADPEPIEERAPYRPERGVPARDG